MRWIQDEDHFAVMTSFAFQVDPPVVIEDDIAESEGAERADGDTGQVAEEGRDAA